jgi:hypothetical protein
MKLILLVGIFVLASAGLAVAQPDQSKCQDTARMAADEYQRTGTPHRPVMDAMAKLVEQRVRMELIERVRKQTGIGVAADCIESRSPSSFRAQGNVTLTVGDVVITADDAVVDEGAIQLLGNARVRLPAK